MKCFTLLAALLSFWPGAVLGASEYRVITEEWAPYNYQESNQITGMTTEVVRAIMALTGDDFELVMLPNLRASRALNTRPKTIFYSMFRTPTREPLYQWVGPIVEESIYPYQLADAEHPVSTLEQLLKAPQVTTRHGGLVPDLLQALGLTNLDSSATGNRQLYRMLLAGRTDIIVGDTPAGVSYYSQKLGIAPGMLRQVPIEVYRASLFIAFSLDCEEAVVTRWADALEQLRSSGELKRIQLRYESVPITGQ